MMWSVDQVKVVGNRTFHAFTKIGTFDQQAPEQSFFLSSPNLLLASNASDVTWEMYPDGEVGVTAPAGVCSGIVPAVGWGALCPHPLARPSLAFAVWLPPGVA